MENKAKYMVKLKPMYAKLTNGYVIIEKEDKNGEKIEKYVDLYNNDIITLNILKEHKESNGFIPVSKVTDGELILTRKHPTKNKTSTLFLLVDYTPAIKELLRLKDYIKCEKEYNGIKSIVFVRKSIIDSITKKENAVFKFRIVTKLPNRYVLLVNKIEL